MLPVEDGLKGWMVVVDVEARGGFSRWNDTILRWWMKMQPSLSSRNTLGDSNHNSNNHKCTKNQNGLVCGSCMWWCQSYGVRPMQKMQNGQNLMESNGGKTKMSSSGTSLAFQRAKEHPNQSSDAKVTAKTVKSGRLL